MMLIGLLVFFGIYWEGWRYLEKFLLVGDFGFFGFFINDIDFFFRLMDFLKCFVKYFFFVMCYKNEGYCIINFGKLIV